MTVVVGDIGATNARFAMAATNGDRTELSGWAKLPSRSFTSFCGMLEAYFELQPEARRCRRACFGLAGHIQDDVCDVTNLGLLVERAAVERHFGFSRALLINDVESAAWGLGELDAGGLHTLRDGGAGGGNRAVVAAGTGLGEAALLWNGSHYVPVATEGGHTDFAPADDQQVALWRFLARQHGHVSWERVLSGVGLVTLLRFLLEERGEDEPEWLTIEGDGDDAAAPVISRRAQEGECELSREALELFFALLGAEAGNLALKFLALDGVYLVGGILPKVLPQLAESRFLDRFEAKGRYRQLLASLPVRVVTDENVCLLGAAARDSFASQEVAV